MPRVARKAHRRRNVYNEHHLSQLREGWSIIVDPERIISFGRDPYRENREAVRAAWEDIGAELIEGWIGEHPGTRPYAWWEFNAPGRRERVDGGVHWFDNETLMRKVRKHAPPDSWVFTLTRGIPRATLDWDDLPEYETERDYLDRHNLLTNDEQEQLRAADAHTKETAS